jgi:hypothetical protein
MPTPTIPAGNLFMNATLYTGNGTTNAITNGNAGQSFQPDLVWCKSRSTALFHGLYNVVSGAGSTKGLYSNDTGAEGAYSAYQNLVSFNSNGFTLGATSLQNNINENGTTFVGWQWKAGGTAVTNTSGTISSQVSANTTSGFSIATYTNVASGVQTVGHGLGVAPSMIFVKFRSTTSDWGVYHSAYGNTGALKLNTTGAPDVNSSWWNNTSPTSSVFTLGTQWNGTATAVAYCWAPIAGYSAFGSYTGNGSADGPFVYTGFRPRWVLWKRSSGVGNWILQDTSRSTYNASDTVLFPELSDAETTGGGYPFDILSNGFKLRNSATYANANGSTYIYACFAENPFKYSNAR